MVLNALYKTASDEVAIASSLQSVKHTCSFFSDCTGSSAHNTNKEWWSREEVCCWVLSYTNHPSPHRTSVQHFPFTADQ